MTEIRRLRIGRFLLLCFYESVTHELWYEHRGCLSESYKRAMSAISKFESVPGKCSHIFSPSCKPFIYFQILFSESSFSEIEVLSWMHFNSEYVSQSFRQKEFIFFWYISTGYRQVLRHCVRHYKLLCQKRRYILSDLPLLRWRWHYSRWTW